MDKKKLEAIVHGMVTQVATAQKIDEQEARALVGMVLRRNVEAIVAACTVPALNIGQQS